MATLKIRYLTSRPGAAGRLPRYFWQPSADLRAQGWNGQRVPLDWHRFTDASALHAAALGRSRPWFLRNRRRLEALGFPPLLPFRLGYDPQTVRAWIARNGGPAALALSDAAQAELRWQTELDRRAEAVGRTQ